jgi:aspartate/tyrosine/aromatic aminotransferase
MDKHGISFDSILTTLKSLPPSSAVLLQAACHNPTGADFSKQQWQTILEVIRDHHLFPIFDNAYQGFGISIEEDPYPIRLFYENNIEMAIATACSKNFGLYGERVGALIFSLHEASIKEPLMSHIRRMIRSQYSSPPRHGAKIVGQILSNPELEVVWKNELDAMRHRVQNMRNAFAKGLIAKTQNPLYHYIQEQSGFFSLLNLNEKQVIKLREEKAIHLPLNGRINMAGLTSVNLDYCLDALAEELK